MEKKFIVYWSEEDNCYLAKSIKFPSVMTHGNTIEDASREMRIVLTEIEKDLGLK